MKKEKVAVYTRVSTNHEEQLTSMKNQKDYYTSYCSRNDYDLTKIYADEGLSATSTKRKAFLEMIHDAGLEVVKNENTNDIDFYLSYRKPKFKYIITKDVTRFSRNVDITKTIRNLREKGVYIVFENAGFSTEENDWELRTGILLLFAQQESLDRSKKVEWAYKQRAKKGIFHMTVPLYGYSYDPNTKEVSIVEKEAEIVREIFDMYANKNMGATLIAVELNERGLKSKKGKKWRSDQIRRMIRNEKYKGWLVSNKWTSTGITGSNRKIHRPEDEWITHEGVIPVIIDEETWDKANEILDNRTLETKTGETKGGRRIENIFHGKMFCDKCGNEYIRHTAHKFRAGEKVKEYIYMCRGKRYQKTCDNKGISHNVLERILVKFGQTTLPHSLSIKTGHEKTARDFMLDEIDERISEIDVVRKEIQGKIDEKSNEVTKLFNNFLSSDASQTIKDATEKRIEELEDEKKKLEKELFENSPAYLEKMKDEIKLRYEKVLEMAGKEYFSFDEVLELLDEIKIQETKENKGKKDKERTIEINMAIPSLIIDELSELPHLYHIDVEKY
ncbi:recombinase family protein [Alteribacillus sp. YIM 98480]|uniref:recombinase family protein n=1 Tax=Alteribacillus sp. YIM 98480 TaxID=2606599 RepID=UPI00131D5ADB|nr:recombinase family protein [Alteribacillus sp. YIM 98480]